MKSDFCSERRLRDEKPAVSAQSIELSKRGGPRHTKLQDIL